MNTHSRRQIFFLVFILICGAAVRSSVYFADRPMDRDEVVLALNVVEGSLSTVFEPQYERKGDPVGYLTVLQGVKSIFGSSPYALRLFSFLISLSALVLFVRFSGKFLNQSASIIATTLFSLNTPAIWFASSTKQYSSDIFFSIALLVILPELLKGDSLKMRFWQSLIGCLVIWVSYPTVFVLAGIATCNIIITIQRREWKKLINLIIPSSFWVISFLICYRTSMRDVTGGGEFYNYWLVRNAYPLSPVSLSGLRWYYSHLVLTFSMIGSFYTPLIVASCALIGGYYLFWKDKANFFILTLPLLFAFFAACLHLYPLPQGANPKMGRFIVWFIPSFLVYIAAGIETVSSVISKHLRPIAGMIFGCFLILQPALFAASEINNPVYLDEVRTALEHISKNQERGDILYGARSVEWFYLYYDRELQLENLTTVWSEDYSDIKLDEPSEQSYIKGKKRVWIIIRATDNAKKIENSLVGKGALILSKELKNCHLYLMDFSTWK